MFFLLVQVGHNRVKTLLGGLLARLPAGVTELVDNLVKISNQLAAMFHKLA